VIEQTNAETNLAAPSGGVELAALLDGWASVGHGTLPRRLAHSLRRAVQAGVLPAGWRLPPERQLAGELAVSRATITDALDELRREGLVTSTQGRGTFVAGGATPSRVGTRVADHLSGGRGIDLATGNPPDLSHLPPIAVDMSMLTAEGGGPGMYAIGLPAMRQAVADLYCRGGFTGSPRVTQAEQIHVTSGAHQAVSLLVATLVGRGGAVALGHFNYPGIFDILDGCEARPVSVRTDRAGMLPESLEQVIVDEHPTALYFQSGAHNPTGRVTPLGRLRAIAEIVDRHGIAVIEDNTLAPLTFSSGLPVGASSLPTMHDLCRTATVASVGSLSKACWAGLRIGWICAPEPLIERTMYHRLALDLGPSAPSQVLAMGLIPHLDDIAAERRRRLEHVVGFAVEHMSSTIPEATVDVPQGGCVLWTEFPVADTGPLVQLARRHGVQIAPGSISVPGRVPGPFVRISVDRPVDLVHEGLDRLGRAWREFSAASPRVTG